MALYRVYKHEWLNVYPSQGRGPDGREECEQVFASKYEGRVRKQDVRIRETIGDHHVLELLLPNLQGEFTGSGAAEELRDGRGDGAVIVEPGDDGEKSLLSYGRRMLRAQ